MRKYIVSLASMVLLSTLGSVSSAHVVRSDDHFDWEDAREVCTSNRTYDYFGNRTQVKTCQKTVMRVMRKVERAAWYVDHYADRYGYVFVRLGGTEYRISRQYSPHEVQEIIESLLHRAHGRGIVEFGRPDPNTGRILYRGVPYIDREVISVADRLRPF
ncbi:hypothetical protein [Pasteuria penetrans]|uniref:hypothetical protein n=1 Tax=Pasteuria penetrans TaxID=86005 RepID=UPI000FB8509F|nr:hypothetical protein [Pasteuria penetrans]